MKMFSVLAIAASTLMVVTAASAQVKQLTADPPPRPVPAESQTLTAQPELDQSRCERHPATRAVQNWQPAG